MKVLATTDGSAYSHEALRRLGGMVPTTGTLVHLLAAYPNPVAGPWNMIGPPYVDYGELARQLQGECEGFLAEGRGILEAQGFQVTTEVVEGDPASSILDAAERLGSDLIVVGSHGRTGLARFVLGSVSGRVVSHAPCSVLVIKHASPAS